MLKRGALDPAEFKVLLLPATQAIGPDEAAAIRRFAQAGGTVIADVRPGIYDDHCKAVTPGVLDDLFGIERTGQGKLTEGPVALKGELEGKPLDLEFALARLDTEVRSAGAQAVTQAGETPVLMVNRVGAGRAILLNFQFVPPKPEDPQAAVARKLLRALYDAAGVREEIARSAPDGGPLPLTETRVWQNGDARIIGLWRQMQCAWFNPKSGTLAGPPEAARITLPAASHVYDLRAHKYLGSATRVDTSLRWGRANFFLALPYQIKAPQVSLSSQTPAAGSTLTASLRLPVPAQAKEKLAVWVEVTDPQGQLPFWGQQLVLLERGAGKVDFPIAYNDLPGRWKLKATELFSNQSAEAAWTIR